MGRRRFGSTSSFLTGKEDPAPDVYAVKRLEGERFVVTHYPHVDATKACCRVTVQTTDADRATAEAEDLEVELVTLRRVVVPCQQAAAKKGAA